MNLSTMPLLFGHLGFILVMELSVILVRIDLDKPKVTVYINTSLLVDSAQALDSTYIEGILTKEISEIVSHNMGLFSLLYLSKITFGNNWIIRMLLGIE